MAKLKRGYKKLRIVSTMSTYVYTLVLSLICWITGYLLSAGYPVNGDPAAPPLWNLICGILPDKTTTYLIGLALTIGGAFLIQRSNYVLILIREKTFLPFVLYILLISTNPDFFPLKSTSVGVFCLILAMYELFTSYHDPESQLKSFNAALLIGLGSLVWIHILWFLPLFWYGMYTFKAMTPRTFLASLLGVTTIYWFLTGWCIWQKDFTPFTVPFTTLVNIRLLMVTGAGWIEWSAVILVAILTLTAAIHILTHEHDDSLRTRQYLWFLIVFACFSFILFFLYEQASEEFLSVACLPASILLAHFFTVKRGNLMFWTYHTSVCLLTIILMIRLWNFLSITVI